MFYFFNSLGLAGTLYFLSDIRRPMEAKFPAFQLFSYASLGCTSYQLCTEARGSSNQSRERTRGNSDQPRDKTCASNDPNTCS